MHFLLAKRRTFIVALGIINIYLLFSFNNAILKDVKSVSAAYRNTHGREPPKGFDSWVRYATRHQCFLNMSYYNQIYKDLDPWMHGNSIKNDFESYVIQNKFHLVGKYIAHIKYESSFGVSQGKGLWKSSYVPSIFYHVRKLLQQDFQFLVTFGLDEPVVLPADVDKEPYKSWEDIKRRNSCIRNTSSTILNSHGFFLGPDHFITNNVLAPIFSQNKHQCFKDIMIPLSYHYYISISVFKDSIHWKKKKNVLFWRGSSTGGSYRTGKPWQKYHRTRLVEWEKNWALNHSDSVFDAGALSDSLEELDQLQVQNKSKILVDIGFNDYIQVDEKTRNVLLASYPLKKPVSFEKTMNFKYLLVVDGNAWPSRIQRYLQTNSVILYSGIFIDYYLGILNPWVHYIPVRTDMSDLEEKISWLLANDDKARAISENANALMVKLGSLNHQICYTGLLLQEYGRLFNQ